jgi:hypothetical protein
MESTGTTHDQTGRGHIQGASPRKRVKYAKWKIRRLRCSLFGGAAQACVGRGVPSRQSSRRLGSLGQPATFSGPAGNPSDLTEIQARNGRNRATEAEIWPLWVEGLR